MEQIIEEIKKEMQRAVTKFPTWPTDPVHASAVVTEESGELAQSVLECIYEPHKSSKADVRAEAIQTATMAIRFLLSMDKYEFKKSEEHTQN